MDEPGILLPVTRSAEGESKDLPIGMDIQQALGALSLDGRTALLMVAGGYSGREIAKAVP